MNRAPRNKIVAPAMTREEWQELPEAVRHFIPWERARQPLTVKKVAPPRKGQGYRYFTDGKR